MNLPNSKRIQQNIRDLQCVLGLIEQQERKLLEGSTSFSPSLDLHSGNALNNDSCMIKPIPVKVFAIPQAINQNSHPFISEFSQLNYRSEQGLNQHVERSHTNLMKNYVCSECGKKYRRKHRLVAHLKLIHRINEGRNSFIEVEE